MRAEGTAVACTIRDSLESKLVNGASNPARSCLFRHLPCKARVRAEGTAIACTIHDSLESKWRENGEAGQSSVGCLDGP